MSVMKVAVFPLDVERSLGIGEFVISARESDRRSDPSGSAGSCASSVDGELDTRSHDARKTTQHIGSPHEPVHIPSAPSVRARPTLN